MIGLEIVGFFGVLAFIAWLVLLWRLSQGPLSVDFLAEKIEQHLNAQQSSFAIDIGTADLIWGDRYEPFEIEIRNVSIARMDKTPVAAIRRVGLQVSKRNLAFGRFVPRTIKVYSPALRVIRGADGRFNLNVADGEQPSIGNSEQPIVEVPEQSQGALIAGLLEQLQEHRASNLFGGLNQIRVDDALVLYDDKVLGVSWRASKADLVFARGRQALVSDAMIEVDMGENRKSFARLSVIYNWNTRLTEATAYFSDFSPARAAQGSALLEKVSGINLPLKGKVSLKLDPDFKMVSSAFILGSDPGTLDAFGLYPEPLQVRGLYLTGQYDAIAGTGEILQCKLKLDGPDIDAKAKLTRAAAGGVMIDATATLEKMPMDELHRYWPESLAPDAHHWVTKHLSRGTADKADIDLRLHLPGGDAKPRVESLGGKIDFHGIDVDYFPPLMKVTGAVGQARYDHTSFNLDISGGALGDMQVKKSKISITDLDKITAETHAHIDISVLLSGSLKTALQVLDSAPLHYPSKMGLKADQVSGTAEVDVNFKFPLYKELTISEVKVAAKADISDVSLPDVAAGYALTGGPLQLALGDGNLAIKGKGRFGGAPIDLDWKKNFTGKQSQSVLKARLPLDAAMLLTFGVPADFAPVGAAIADVAYAAGSDGTARLELESDIADLGFAVPVASFVKEKGQAGKLGLSLKLRNNTVEKIENLSLMTGSTVAKGDISFSGGNLQTARFDDLRLGATRVSLGLENKGAQGYALKVSGAQYDASTFFPEKAPVNSNTEAAKEVTPLKLNMNVDRLITGKDRSLDKVSMFLHRNQWQRIEQLEIDATVGGKPLHVRYKPSGGGKALTFEAGNAGAALSALGFTQSVRGGKLSIVAQPFLKSGVRDMAGTAILTNFMMKDAPALARLLNAMSLSGINQLMTSKGIDFKKARVKFTWLDRGPPTHPNNNMRLIKLSDGQTSGASLGLTFEGNIDNWNNLYDLNGTIIPVSDISKIISAIPLVGDVLTAGGEGLIAATYTIKGDKDNPNVSVNPLAALAPGILRKLFFEN